MNIGALAIDLSFGAALAAAVLFFRKESGKTALLLFRVSAVAIAVGSAMLFGLLFGHAFQYTYVAQYSSSTQAPLYLVSAFWAGQEGTFLLWALFVCLMTVAFTRRSAQPEGIAMGVVSGFVAFLSLLMIVKSPFATTATPPADGSGMNPLLQNFWMAIHPPVLFVGYAAAVFPFALVASGLLRKDFAAWFEHGFRWTVFAAATLGAGIIIGGFWAYEVLGWGGYWGWDPVENSSLVPWLTLLALIHGLLVQKAKGSLMRTNIALTIVSFVLVLYATFLTRSGVLQDFSVHSFQDLGIGNYLIGSIIVTVLLGFGPFAARFRSMHPPKIKLTHLTREVTLLLSIFVLCAGALFTFAGMSSPIITGLFGKASQVDISFYNKVNFPVAIAMAILLGVTPFLAWSGENPGPILKRLSLPLVLTALACIIAFVAGVQTVPVMLFVGTAAFALISNAIISVRQYRAAWWNLGGPVAHVGVGLLLIGIIGSGKFDETSRLVMRQGETQSAFGYQFTFGGVHEGEGVKSQVHLDVTDGKTSYTAYPKLYYSEYNRAMMREPDIRIMPLKDLYLSPLEITSPESEAPQIPQLELTKGEMKQYGAYQITFTRFDVGQHGETADMSVGAVLRISHDGKVEELVPKLLISPTGDRHFVPVAILTNPGVSGDTSKTHVALTQLNVEQKKVVLEFFGPGHGAKEAQVPRLVLEVSVKPLMMVVWTGVLLIIAGSVLSFVRRIRRSEGSITT